MNSQKRTAEALLYTERGRGWLAQFDASDQEAAEKIVTSLTLVSHSEFERVIQSALERLSSTHEQPIALHAVRQVDEHKSYRTLYTDLETRKVNAL